MSRLEHFIVGTKNRGNLVGVYNPRGNGRGGSHGHMTACCYAACSKETSDNADQGPQRRRKTAQYRCHSSSLFEGGGRERYNFLMMTRCEVTKKITQRQGREISSRC